MDDERCWFTNHIDLRNMSKWIWYSSCEIYEHFHWVVNDKDNISDLVLAKKFWNSNSMIRLTHEGDERLVAFWRSLLPLAQYPSYHDVNLVCQDGETRGNRLLLALAIPHMEQLLREMEGSRRSSSSPSARPRRSWGVWRISFKSSLGRTSKMKLPARMKASLIMIITWIIMKPMMVWTISMT